MPQDPCNLKISILDDERFYGMPWNCSCHRNWRTSSSIEFHGTAAVSEIGALQVQWNSMELLMSSKLAHLKSHEIPWHCSCHRNWRITSSMEFMEFHGIVCVREIGAYQIPWNSIKFHGTARVIEIGALQVPHHGIPGNCSYHRNWRIPSYMKLQGISWNCSWRRNWCTPSSM